MKTFFFDATNDEQHRVFTVRASSLDEAFKLSKFQMAKDEIVYQVSTRKKGYKFPQPVWDLIHGSLENKKALLAILKE